MRHRLFKIIILLMAGSFQVLRGAENNDGKLGSVSTGTVNMTLKVTEGISAGFVRTNLDEPESGYQKILSFTAIEKLQRERSATIPFCIISSNGGSFEIDPFEYGGLENRLQSEFGSAIPFEVIIGDGTRPDLKYRSVPEGCDNGSTIPVTIRMQRQLNGGEVGRISGKFNLLIKTE